MYLEFVKFYRIYYYFLWYSVINTKKVESSFVRLCLVHMYGTHTDVRAKYFIKYSLVFFLFFWYIRRNCINKDFLGGAGGKIFSSLCNLRRGEISLWKLKMLAVDGKMCFHRHIWQRMLEIWLTGQTNFHVFWEMEWKQKSTLLKAKLIFRTEWIGDTLSQSQTRANIFTRADIFPKNKSKKIKINPNWKRKLIFRSFFNVHTSAVNCWSELLMSCCFIHDFFTAAFSLSSNLNVCPRSLMTLTTFLWIFVFFFHADSKKTRPKVYFLAE